MFIKKMSMLPHNWSKYKGNLSEHKSENFVDMGEGNDQTKMNDTNQENVKLLEYAKCQISTHQIK